MRLVAMVCVKEPTELLEPHNLVTNSSLKYLQDAFEIACTVQNTPFNDAVFVFHISSITEEYMAFLLEYLSNRHAQSICVRFYAAYTACYDRLCCYMLNDHNLNCPNGLTSVCVRCSSFRIQQLE